MKTLDLADEEAICILRHVRAALAACKERKAQMELTGPPKDRDERQQRKLHAMDCEILERVQQRLWRTIAGGGGIS